MKSQLAEMQKAVDVNKIKNLRNELDYKVFETYYGSIKTCTGALQTFADTFAEIADADWDEMNFADRFKLLTNVIFNTIDAVVSLGQA